LQSCFQSEKKICNAPQLSFLILPCNQLFRKYPLKNHIFLNKKMTKKKKNIWGGSIFLKRIYNFDFFRNIFKRIGYIVNF
jgi:hypothetical protein